MYKHTSSSASKTRKTAHSNRRINILLPRSFEFERITIHAPPYAKNAREHHNSLVIYTYQ